MKPTNEQIGSDPELNEAIKQILESTGFECNDMEAISLIEAAIRKKIEIVISNANIYSYSQENSTDKKVLNVQQLKSALNEEKVRIDRPDFIVEQTQLKANTRDRKSTRLNSSH